MYDKICLLVGQTGLEVINLEYSLRLKIKRNDWLLAGKCPQAANHSVFFSMRMNLSFITSTPGAQYSKVCIANLHWTESFFLRFYLIFKVTIFR